MTTQRHWYNDKQLFLHGLVRSNYVTAVTDWFMGLAGKLTELVLYGTILYSCAQLYPGVNLPGGLSLAVFLIQMGALDIGGLSLAKLARQAREDGNAAGAKQAEALSRWLIGIMLTGVVTVGVEHVVPIPAQAQTGVEIVLVVARSVCSVLYGRVVHLLKGEAARVQRIPDVDIMHHLQACNEQLQRIEQRFSDFHQQHVEAGFQELLHESLAPIVATLQFHSERLSLLPTLNEQLDQIDTVAEYQLRITEEVTRVKATLERIGNAPRTTTNQLAPLTRQARARSPLQLAPGGSVPRSTGEFDKAQFVYACLREYPDMKIADIQQRAAERGQTISVGSVSQHRKAFFESVKAAESESPIETEVVAAGQ